MPFVVPCCLLLLAGSSPTTNNTQPLLSLFPRSAEGSISPSLDAYRKRKGNEKRAETKKEERRRTREPPWDTSYACILLLSAVCVGVRQQKETRRGAALPRLSRLRAVWFAFVCGWWWCGVRGVLVLAFDEMGCFSGTGMTVGCLRRVVLSGFVLR